MQYKAKVIEVVDGDTFKAQIDLGFGVFTIQKIRMLGINAPELHGDEKAKGEESAEYLKQLIEGKDVLIEPSGIDRYGRRLATVFLEDGTNINELLVKQGYADIYKGVNDYPSFYNPKRGVGYEV